MKKSILSVSALALLMASCNIAPDKFLIQKQNIGLLTDSTQVKDLATVFAEDSVTTPQKSTFGSSQTIDIFDVKGEQLLSLTPRSADSTSTIESVQITDDRFKTEQDITKLSTFKDITDNYTISKINGLLRTLVVSVKELNVSFTIDKEELPGSVRFDSNKIIEASQIPDGAKIKYFMVHW